MFLNMKNLSVNPTFMLHKYTPKLLKMLWGETYMLKTGAFQVKPDKSVEVIMFKICVEAVVV